MNDFIKNNEAGRVIDLKKIREPENKAEIAPEPKAKGGFFWFRQNLPQGDSDDGKHGRIRSARFCRDQKTQHVDFLKHYRNLEKKEEFVEREIMKEYLDENEEEKKENILVSFFNFITRVLNLWWLPLFVIRFVWILFWRITKLILFRGASRNKKARPRTREAAGEKRRKKKDLILRESAAWEVKGINKIISPSKSVRSGAWSAFWQSLWSMPREILNFLLGRATDDYLYQRVLWDEVTKKKFHPFRHVFVFVFLALLLILPLAALNLYNAVGVHDLRGKVLGATDRAITDLQSAAQAATGLDMKQASENFDAAKASFAEANNDLSQVSGIIFELGKIIPNDQIRLAAQSREIIAAGTAAASLGNNLSLAINALLARNEETLTAKIDDFLQDETLAAQNARELNEEIGKIDTNALPVDYRGEFDSLKQKAADLDLILNKNISLIRKLNIFLGEKTDKRYLLVFEDNAEMRASGGFVGSYALLDLSRGKITNLEAPAGGSYDTKGGLNQYIIPPLPLTLINPRWYFWDANWWPDWAKSAQKLAWFYAKSGGPTTDGVIAFTPTVLERILAIIGPVDMTDTNGMVMTSDNLWANLRSAIDQEKAADGKLPYDLAENKPKKIIGVFMQKLMAEIPQRLDRGKFISLLESLQLDLNDKQILLYSGDSDLQAEIEARNWGGRIKDADKDYLMVVDTNIAGGKSDRLVTENIDQRADVQSDGSIIDTLTITRANDASSSQLFAGERNVDWLRVYVPSGSRLLQSAGWQAPAKIYFNTPDLSGRTDPEVAAEEGTNAIVDAAHSSTTIYSDSGKTVFANWSMADPGQTAVITLRYQLPFKLENTSTPAVAKAGLAGLIDKMVAANNTDQMVYSLLWQKQPGAARTTVNSTLSLPAEFKLDWNYPADLAAGSNGWQTSSNLDGDKYWAAVIEKSGN
ncbi:MAG TPA: DUF4012 domain-containing protein [Candidatus Nanoarchaeia archaeon]|nr:DUF4012 domain-containing protein [Candidatus Nanoarchaeia archaeon]